jgi:uncharacterized phage-associated protein
MTFQSYQKITEALNYLAIKCGVSKQINKMRAIKLLYYADRYHLRKYGRPLTGDTYLAMGYGPVGSLAKDIAENSEFLDEEARSYGSEVISPVSQHEFKSVRETALEFFSETDREALDFVIKKLAQFNGFDLADLSHAYPEWKKHEKVASHSGSRVPMDYLDFFENPEANDPLVKKFLNGKDIFQDESCPDAKEIFQEFSQLEKQLE